MSLQESMKYLFIVDHFVPFPQSEYGGLWNVIAENEEECFDLIRDYQDNYPGDYSKLRLNIQKSSKYALLDEIPSKVVTSFLT
jgi:hypothetical protein